MDKFTSPIVKKYGDEAKEVGGHGGMDYLLLLRLCVRRRLR